MTKRPRAASFERLPRFPRFPNRHQKGDHPSWPRNGEATPQNPPPRPCGHFHLLGSVNGRETACSRRHFQGCVLLTLRETTQPSSSLRSFPSLLPPLHLPPRSSFPSRPPACSPPLHHARNGDNPFPHPGTLHRGETLATPPNPPPTHAHTPFGRFWVFKTTGGGGGTSRYVTAVHQV